MAYNLRMKIKFAIIRHFRNTHIPGGGGGGNKN